MRAAPRFAALCCVLAAAAAYFLPEKGLLLPEPYGEWEGDVAMSAEYYVTAVPLPYGSGIVNVFKRDGKFMYSLYSRAPVDLFGVSLELQGDNLFVGAPGTDQFNGVVYQFSVSSGKLLHTITSTAEHAVFGASIAACGGSSELLVIGAPEERVEHEHDDDYEYEYEYGYGYYGGANSYGAAYLYDIKERKFRRRLVGPVDFFSDSFGAAVACGKGIVAVGAPEIYTPEYGSMGIVSIFDMEGEQRDVLEGPDSFGYSIAIGDNYIGVGAPWAYSSYSWDPEGRVDMFKLDDLSCRKSVIGYDGAMLGMDISASGDKFAVTQGSPYDEFAAVFSAELDFYFQLAADYYVYDNEPGTRVVLSGDTVLTSVQAYGYEPEAMSLEMDGAAEFKPTTNSTNTANATSDHQQPRESRPRVRPSRPSRPRATALRTRRGVRAAKHSSLEDDDYEFDGYYTSTGFVFELTYPRASMEAISGENAAGDGSFETYNDAFGTSVATSHMYTVVGAPNTSPDDGLVHVYSADRKWLRTLRPLEDYAAFGFSVALFSDWVLVGAPEAHSSRGAAYLYSAVTGKLLYELPAADLWYDTRFGHSVALCGDNGVAVVGMPSYYPEGDYAYPGAARVFRLTPQGAVEIATIEANSPSNRAYFGASVSCVGRNILVGAPYHQSEGAAYLYELSEDLNDVTFRHRISASIVDYYSWGIELGASVALDDNRLVVGAPYAENSINYEESGAVVVFELPAPDSAMGNHTILYPEDPVEGARFGFSVALHGDLLVVGADRASGHFPRTGAVYTFDLAKNVQLEKLVQDRIYGVVEDQFGVSVAIGGGHVLVGRNLSEYSLDDWGGGEATHHEPSKHQRKRSFKPTSTWSHERSAASYAEGKDGDSCDDFDDVVHWYDGGTAHFFLNMYEAKCVEAVPPAPGTPIATELTAFSAVIEWTPSFATCYPVASYVVYVRADGGSYEQAALVHGANWATVELEPSTQYRAKVAAVNSLGNVVYSTPSEPFTTPNVSYIRFPPSGVELDVYIHDEFAEPATSGERCALVDYFSDPEYYFGFDSSCRFVDSHLMKVQLTAGAAVQPFDRLNFTGFDWETTTEFEVQPPEPAPLAITGTLSWAVEGSFCDDIVLDASSVSGVGGSVYGFEYEWSIDGFTVNGVVPEDLGTYEALFANVPETESVVVFPNGTFPPGSEMEVFVTVSSPVFDTHLTLTRWLKVSEMPVPKISMRPAALRVSIADPVTVQVDIDYGACFLDWAGPNYVPKFSWAIEGGAHVDPSLIEPKVSADTRSISIPGFVLKDTGASGPYIVIASLVLPQTYAQPEVLTTEAMVEVFTYAPVAYISGGDHAVAVSDGTAVVDASLSYDPNYCTAFGLCKGYLSFGFDCSYSDGSTCCGLAASAEPTTVLDLAKALECSPEGSVESGSAVVTVQVTVMGIATGLSASSSVRLELVSGGDGARSVLSVEPVLPTSFSGFVGLSSPSVDTSLSPASSSASLSPLSSAALAADSPTTPPTWSVVRILTSQVMASMQGETAIFDPSVWPAGERFTVEASNGHTTVRMSFYTPLPPQAGTFRLRLGPSYLDSDTAVPGLTTPVSLHALDFVASTGSSGGGLTYQFTTTTEVFSAANGTIFPITLLLNEPSSASSLAGLVLPPGDHTLQVTVRNRENGVTTVTSPRVVSSPYTSFAELLDLVVSFRDEELAVRSNGVGAFAAAMTWIGQDVLSEDVCGEYAPTLSAAQEKLLRVWLDGASRASQQAKTAVKALQDVYMLTLPGLCVENSELALGSLQATLEVFQAIPEDDLPADSCRMMTQVLSAVLALPAVQVADMDALQVVLQFMDEVLASYCGVSVFTYDASSSTGSSAFLAAASFLRDVSVSSVRAPPGQPLQLDLDGLAVEVGASAAADLSRQLSGSSSSDLSSSGFWDVSSYRLSRNSLSLPGLDGVLSDVFELNIRQATLPGFRFCNKVPGAVASSDACVTKRVGASSVSGLRSPIVFTVLADAVTASGYTHSCQYVNTETNEFSRRGCKVVSVVPQGNTSASDDGLDDDLFGGNSTAANSTTPLVAVTCACDHMTAFAVRQMALQGKSDCDDLSAQWKDTYHTPQYKAFATLMLLGWLGLLVMLTMWLWSVGRTLKHTNASLVANLVFYPACLLRIVYFAMLLHGFEVSSNVACDEFGISGSGSGYGQYTMLVLHDLAEPILLIAFTSIVVYWYELEKSLSGPLSKMLSAKYLSTNTLWLFIAINVLLLVVLVGVNFGLLAPGDNDREDTNDAARALLVVHSVVCIVEAVAFVWYGWAVVKAGGGVDKMRKVVKLLCSSSAMFILMAVLQIVFASPDTVSDARVAYGLYSILLHLAEFAGAAMMIQALAVNRKDSRTMIGSLLQRFTASSSGSHRSGKWWPTSFFTSSSSGGGSGHKSSSASATGGAAVAVPVAKDAKGAKDMELVVSHYDFANDQYVSRSAKGGKVDGGNAATSATAGESSMAVTSMGSADSSRAVESSLPVHELRDSEDVARDVV